MSVYLRAKFEVSSIIRTSFRHRGEGGRVGGGGFRPAPTSKRIPKNPSHVRIKKAKRKLAEDNLTKYNGIKNELDVT